MSRSLLLTVYLATFAPIVAAQPTELPETDRIRLAEAFRLADAVQDSTWSGWSEVPFSLLLVTPEHEFLIRHPQPSEDFSFVEYDSFLQSEVYVRPSQFPPNLLATFPAVGGIPTIVIGQPEQTGKTSTFWVITALHEHFHQLQNTQADYFDSIEALDLAGDDSTGMWMLNYPFPYDSVTVEEHFSDYTDALIRAFEGHDSPNAETLLHRYFAARERLRDALDEKDYRYFSFQLWQEGVARYTEYRVAEKAANEYNPLPEFQALDDFVPYSAAVDSLKQTLAEEWEALNLASSKRVAFYPVGATEALLLDATRPDWQQRYFTEKFFLERYFEKP